MNYLSLEGRGRYKVFSGGFTLFYGKNEVRPELLKA